MTHDDFELLRGLIGRRAGRLAAADRGPDCDRDDFFQELALRLLEGLPGYDPDRGPPGPFAKLVLDRAAGQVRRSRTTRTHARRAAGPRRDATPVEPAADDCRLALIDLVLDVAAVLAVLPPDLRALADELAGGVSLAAAARARGVPRSTLQRRVAALARFLAGHGLGEFR